MSHAEVLLLCSDISWFCLPVLFSAKLVVISSVHRGWKNVCCMFFYVLSTLFLPATRTSYLALQALWKMRKLALTCTADLD